MRASGVHSLAVSCHLCHHEAIISAALWPDDVPVPVFGPRMVCTPMRDHWRPRAADLARAASAGEPERRPMAVKSRSGPGAERLRALRLLAGSLQYHPIR
jgi:hypothetical protein